jgi:hypothetical protein
MADEKKVVEPALSGFYEAMERSNADKIAHETLDGISEDSNDSESFDIESGSEDVDSRPWRQATLSSVNQSSNRGKSTQ